MPEEPAQRLSMSIVQESLSEPLRYANNVLLSMTQHEAVLDFFLVGPTFERAPQPIHIARIALPVTSLRGLVRAFQLQIDHYEATWKLELPDMPPHPHG